jgi:hypothetical protein
LKSFAEEGQLFSSLIETAARSIQRKYKNSKTKTKVETQWLNMLSGLASDMWNQLKLSSEVFNPTG